MCHYTCTSNHCHIHAAFITYTPYKFDGAPRTLTWQSSDLVSCNFKGNAHYVVTSKCMCTLGISRYKRRDIQPLQTFLFQRWL